MRGSAWFTLFGHVRNYTLQKQVGCFNHRVVTLVDSHYETNCIRQPKRQPPSSSYNHNALTTCRTSVKESLQMHFKVAVKNFHALDASRCFPSRCSEGCQCIVAVR